MSAPACSSVLGLLLTAGFLATGGDQRYGRRNAPHEVVL